jgi:hypothetical protein
MSSRGLGVKSECYMNSRKGVKHSFPHRVQIRRCIKEAVFHEATAVHVCLQAHAHVHAHSLKQKLYFNTVVYVDRSLVHVQSMDERSNAEQSSLLVISPPYKL